MSTAKKIISVRSDALIALPIAKIGWSQLDKPDDNYQKYSLDYPCSEIGPQAEANIDKEFKTLLADIKEQLGKVEIETEMSTLEEHIAESSKEADEDYAVEGFGEYIRVGMQHKEGVSKKGKEYVIRPRVYGADKKPIPAEDVPALLPGSIVKPIVQVGLYSPAPATKKAKRSILTSVKLYGVILVEPRVRGGGGALDDSFFDDIDAPVDNDADDADFEDGDF